MVDLSADSLIFAMTDEIRDAFRCYRHVSVFRQYAQGNLLGGCWEEGLRSIFIHFIILINMSFVGSDNT